MAPVLPTVDNNC
jgi:hypothetical protein